MGWSDTSTTGVKALPRAIETGSKEYYRLRHQDFVSRNPGASPPAYYLRIGQRYLDGKGSLAPGTFSPQGLAWQDLASRKLQEAMEARRRKDPSAFAELERDGRRLHRFAYDTHPAAFVEAGLLELPAQDIFAYVARVDPRDLLSPDGMAEVLSVLGYVGIVDLWHIARASVTLALADHCSKATGPGRLGRRGTAVRHGTPSSSRKSVAS